jgi:ribosomal-protein-alanine N-acetyltransferase
MRGFLPDDLLPLCAILSDREVIRYMPRTDPWPEEVVRRWMNGQDTQWSRHGFGWWALEGKADGQLIGWCGLGTLDETSEVEVLYLLAQRYWRRGLATEAARASLRRGFEEHGMQEIIGLVHPENVASRRVLEKCGLKPVDNVHYFGMELLRFKVRKEDYPSEG